MLFLRDRRFFGVFFFDVTRKRLTNEIRRFFIFFRPYYASSSTQLGRKTLLNFRTFIVREKAKRFNPLRSEYRGGGLHRRRSERSTKRWRHLSEIARSGPPFGNSPFFRVKPVLRGSARRSLPALARFVFIHENHAVQRSEEVTEGLREEVRYGILTSNLVR